MGGKGAVVSLTRCDNWYLTVLWVGSRSWTRATVPTAKMTAAATMVHGRLSVD